MHYVSLWKSKADFEFLKFSKIYTVQPIQMLGNVLTIRAPLNLKDKNDIHEIQNTGFRFPEL